MPVCSSHIRQISNAPISNEMLWNELSHQDILTTWSKLRHSSNQMSIISQYLLNCRRRHHHNQSLEQCLYKNKNKKNKNSNSAKPSTIATSSACLTLEILLYHILKYSIFLMFLVILFWLVINQMVHHCLTSNSNTYKNPSQKLWDQLITMINQKLEYSITSADKWQQKGCLTNEIKEEYWKKWCVVNVIEMKIKPKIDHTLQ